METNKKFVFGVIVMVFGVYALFSTKSFGDDNDPIENELSHVDWSSESPSKPVSGSLKSFSGALSNSIVSPEGFGEFTGDIEKIQEEMNLFILANDESCERSNLKEVHEQQRANLIHEFKRQQEDLVRMQQRPFRAALESNDLQAVQAFLRQSKNLKAMLTEKIKSHGSEHTPLVFTVAQKRVQALSAILDALFTIEDPLELIKQSLLSQDKYRMTLLATACVGACFDTDDQNWQQNLAVIKLLLDAAKKADAQWPGQRIFQEMLDRSKPQIEQDLNEYGSDLSQLQKNTLLRLLQ